MAIDFVVVQQLAEVNVGYLLGQLAMLAIFPVAGLILFVVGVRQQSRARQRPVADPPPAPAQPDAMSTAPEAPSSPQYDPNAQPLPKPSRWSVALIIVGSLLMIFGLLGIASSTTDLVRRSRGAAEAAQAPNVGQCIAVSNFQQHTKNPKAKDCSEPDAIFEVVTKGGPSSTCPDGKTEKSDYAFLREGSTTLCFILNFTLGRCYTAAGDTQGQLFTPADCAGLIPRIKVVRRVDGSSDTGSCPEGTKGIAYQNPARLYCLQPLAN